MEDVSIVGLDLAKLCVARGCLEVSSLLSLRNWRRVSSLWKTVRQPISGPVRSARWAMMSGWCRPHTLSRS